MQYLCYKIKLTKFGFVLPNIKIELVCATGTCNLTKRKIAALSIYLPPCLPAAELTEAVQALVDCVDQVVTKYPDAIIIVGGDFNNKDLSLFKSAHANIKPIGSGATRRGACLDEIYTNMHDSKSKTTI